MSMTDFLRATAPPLPGGGGGGGYGGGGLAAMGGAGLMPHAGLAMVPNTVTEVVMAYPDACGKIIGRGGETIQQLQAQTGANIKVQPSQEVGIGQQRRVTISGAPSAVAAAKRLVEDFIQDSTGTAHLSAMMSGHPGGVPRGDAPPPPPGTLLPIAAPAGYVPPPPRGSYGLSSGGGGGMDEPGVTLPITADMVGRIIGRGGETIRRLQDESGARIQVERDQGQVRIRGNPGAVEMAQRLVQEVIQTAPGLLGGPGGGGGYGGGGGGGGMLALAGASATVQTMGQEGRIIGRGGETIRELQQRTGCRVQIDRNANVVNITGPSQAAVDGCAREVQDLVQSGRDGPRGGGGGGMMGAPGGYGSMGAQGSGAYGAPAAGGYGGAYGQQAGGYAQPQAQPQYGGGYAPAASAFTGAPGGGGGAPPSVWIPQTTAEGHTYWYSTVTGESVWEKPADA